MRVINVRIQNMTCSACEKVVTKRLLRIGGVQVVKVDVSKGMAEVSAANEINKGDIEKALAGTHYEVVGLE